jgi:hypothetical protein
MKEIYHIIEPTTKTVESFSNMKLCYETYKKLCQNEGYETISYSTFVRKLTKPPFLFLGYYITNSLLYFPKDLKTGSTLE